MAYLDLAGSRPKQDLNLSINASGPVSLNQGMHAHGVGKPAGNRYGTEHGTGLGRSEQRNGVGFGIVSNCSRPLSMRKSGYALQSL